MSDKKYKAIIKSYTVTDGTVLERNDKSRIDIENTGTVDCSINVNIPLPAGAKRKFHERPDVIIDTDFEIAFDRTQTGTKQLLIIETYYTAL